MTDMRAAVRPSSEPIHARIDRLQREWNRPDPGEGEAIDEKTAALTHQLADHLAGAFVGPTNEGELEFERDDEEGGTYLVTVLYLRKEK